MQINKYGFTEKNTMSEIFKKITTQFKNKLPFVVYCKPNSEKTIAFFQKNNTLFEIENDDVSGFAFVSFNNLQRYIIPENECTIYFEKRLRNDYYLNPKQAASSKIDTQAKFDFEKLVDKALKSIAKNEFEKVVLSRQMNVTLENFDLESIFNKLVFHYKSAFNYIFYHPKIGLWIGATPEQLVCIEGLTVKTVSLAGTQLFNENTTTNWEQKEIKEQQIVSAYVAKILKKISDSITISEPYTVRAGNLVHLKTDLDALMPAGFKVATLVTLLHPTPAVCGFPKLEAMQFITNEEKYKREFYTGYVGEWQKNFDTYNKNSSDLFVNLRCMKIENNQAQLFVGCGITKDSKAEKEFFETENKLQTMLSVL